MGEEGKPAADGEVETPGAEEPPKSSPSEEKAVDLPTPEEKLDNSKALEAVESKWRRKKLFLFWFMVLFWTLLSLGLRFEVVVLGVDCLAARSSFRILWFFLISLAYFFWSFWAWELALATGRLHAVDVVEYFRTLMECFLAFELWVLVTLFPLLFNG